MKSTFLILSIIAGALVPYQAALNGMLNRYMSSPLQASLVNFTGGVVFVVVILLFLRPAVPALGTLESIPWYLYLGGLLGVCFVTIALLAVPRIGGTAFLAAMLTGQMAGAMLMDHFGLLDVPVHPISMTRLAGVGLLGVGIWLVQTG
jgi:bacterial/archaeal transporter family-2 protein